MQERVKSISSHGQTQQLNLNLDCLDIFCEVGKGRSTPLQRRLARSIEDAVAISLYQQWNDVLHERGRTLLTRRGQLTRQVNHRKDGDAFPVVKRALLPVPGW